MAEIAAKTAYAGGAIRFPAGERAFRPHVRGRARSDSGAPRMSFSRAVSILVTKGGGPRRGSGGIGRGRGRGAHAAHPSWAYAQRVIIKARVVRNQNAGRSSSLREHVNYVERDGVDKNGQKGRSFGVDSYLSEPEVEQFLERAHADRHHFRFIISPEHGSQLNLQAFTRELMMQAEVDLGTELDWLAVEHHNTDNPHVHLIVRGVDERGADLVIARDYISRGLRGRAQHIATRELGPRRDAEIARERAEQLHADRVTPLDRTLAQQAARAAEFLDLRPPPERVPDFREEQRLTQIARLHHLESLGLATEVLPGRWELDADVIERLAALARRAELVAQLAKHAGGQFFFRDIDIYDKSAAERPEIEALVVGRGKTDELSEHDYLMVASVLGPTSGTVYRVALSAFSERGQTAARPGQIVQVNVYERAAISPADHNILEQAAAYQGVYSAERHYDHVKQRWRALGRGDEDAEGYIQHHVRRLEGHERRGLVKKLGAELYLVPADLKAQLEQIALTQRHHGSFVQIRALSQLTLDQQVSALGPTWLDGQLARGVHLTGAAAVGASTAERRVFSALQERIGELTHRGFDIERRRLARVELDRLYADELAHSARELSAKFGRYLQAGAISAEPNGVRRVRGRIARVVDLASGPHSVIVTSEGFLLLPSRGNVAHEVDREVSVEIREGRAPDETRATALQRTVRFAAIERERAVGRGR